MIRSKRTVWMNLGLVGLLALTSACGDKKGPGGKTKSGTSSSSPAGDGSATQNSPAGQTQTVKQPAFECSQLELKHCEKALFGKKRCKKDGKQCVEDTSSKPPETCSELNDDDCTKSLACTAEGDGGCREDNTFLVAPCKDKNLKDCSGECRRDTILPVCLANKEAVERKGRCVFRTELCNSNAACGGSLYGDHCVDVAIPDPTGGSCKMPQQDKLCALLIGTQDHDVTLAQADEDGTDVNDAAALCVKDTDALAVTAPALSAENGDGQCAAALTLSKASIIAVNNSVVATDALVCASIPVVGAIDNDNMAADDMVRGEGGAGGGGIVLTVTGEAIAEREIDKEDHVNKAGWCQWKAAAVDRCHVNTAVLRDSILCHKSTKADCEAVPKMHGSSPCSWLSE